MSPGEHDIDVDGLAARIDALPGVAAVRDAAAGSGVAAYLVGGAVRDLLLGAERADLDVAVEGDPAALAAALGGAIRTHERFATATVRTDGLTLDIARTRTEVYRHPGALPEVAPGGLDDDLARRDFTINAIAVPLTADPVPIDPHGGIGDLRARLLRPLHDRSFADDPTRALRAARYVARHDLTPAPGVEKALRATDLTAVSADRVEGELRKLAHEPHPAGALELLVGWGLATADPGVVAAALAVLGDPAWQGLAERAEVVLAASGVTAGTYSADPAPRRLAGKLAGLAPERPSAAVEAARGQAGVTLVLGRALGVEWLDPYVAEWRHVRLEISGADVMAAGVEEGPAVGRALRTALAAKLDGEAHGREEELRVALVAAEHA